jgi:hypothetical protein
LDGSFTTDKAQPNDYDGCWDPEGVDLSKLDPVLFDFANGRMAQKQKYFGEMFIATLGSEFTDTFLTFLQIEKSTGEKKGIIGIRSLGREASQ